MTSRELIKTLSFIALSVFIHVLLFKGVHTSLSPDIKFKRRKTEMNIRPFRPQVPQITKDVQKAVKEGVASPGISGIVEKREGKDLERDTVGQTKIAEEVSPNRYAHEELTGDEVGEDILRDFFAMIKSEKFQNKLRDIEEEREQMWKGKGVSSRGMGGMKDGKIGGGFRQGYLDPRIQVVVVTYPSTSIEKNYPPISYPDMKVKKHELQSGWCNVVLQIYTDNGGSIVTQNVLRPRGNDARDRLFLEHTLDAVKNWRFDGKKAEIIIDVRYYVE